MGGKLRSSKVLSCHVELIELRLDRNALGLKVIASALKRSI